MDKAFCSFPDVRTDEANGPERRMDVLRAQADALNALNKAETAENDSTNIRRCQIDLKT